MLRKKTKISEATPQNGIISIFTRSKTIIINDEKHIERCNFLQLSKTLVKKEQVNITNLFLVSLLTNQESQVWS